MVEMSLDFNLNNNVVTTNTPKMAEFVVKKAEDNLNNDSVFIGVMRKLANE